MKEEDEIKRLCGNGNPFTVPEGYFETFSKRLMENLPERTKVQATKRVSFYRKWRPWVCAAAVVTGLFFGKVLLDYTLFSDNMNEAVLSENITQDSGAYIESIISSAMMDDYAIYCYLTDAE